MLVSPQHYFLLHAVERLIDDSVRQCYPRAWNEDHITYSWLNTLRREWSKVPFLAGTPLAVRWDAYKMDGVLEEDNGDVAFLIDIRFANGNTLQGVGFLEAKRIYPSGRFDALKWAQLKGLSSNSNSHQLLLYDHDPLPTSHSHFEWTVFPECGACGNEADIDCLSIGSEKSLAIVVPSFHAIAFEEKGRQIESIGYRLSEQIVMRYFRGLDLNFDETLVAKVLAGAAGGAKFLAVATVAIGVTADEVVESAPPRPAESSGYRPIERVIQRGER
jgi:hypothetical protein